MSKKKIEQIILDCLAFAMLFLRANPDGATVHCVNLIKLTANKLCLLFRTLYFLEVFDLVLHINFTNLNNIDY